MDKVKILLTVYITVFVLATASLGISILNNASPIVSPVGKSISVLAASSDRSLSNIVYGFLPYWMLENSKFIQMDKITDIAYFALRINPDGSIMTRDYEGFIEPGYDNWKNSKTLDNLIKKAKANNVRFALTIISHDDDITYEFLDCRNCWDVLADNIIAELKSKGIKDLNMDFELVEANAKEGYPEKYSQLVNYLNFKLDEEFENSFVVTSTLPDSVYKPRITDISTLSNASDALFVMAYDFHRPSSQTAGPVAPLEGGKLVADYDITTMLDDYLLQAPANKLVLGVPYYGYNWLVYDWSSYATRIPGNDVLGYSISQTYEHVNDTKLAYSPTVLWDELAKVPYFTYFNSEKGTNRQVYYEDVNSLREKYQFAKKKNLAGIGIWALGYDGGYQELWQLLGEEFYD